MIHFALLGCGNIARRYAELLSGKVAGAKLSCVFDLDQNRGREFSKRYGVKSYDNVDEMFKEKIDVVCVLTPSGLHPKHVIEMARYKKHVLVEKPMALTSTEADAMIVACETAGVKLFVVKQNRYNLPVMRLREVYEKGAFGRLIMGTVRVRWCRHPEYYKQESWRGTRSFDGSVLANQASHHLDLMDWFFGPVKSVNAKGKSFLSGTEAEDTAVAMLEFKNGAYGLIEATTATRPQDVEGSFSIMGERGLVEIGGFAVNQTRVWQFEKSLQDVGLPAESRQNPEGVSGYGHWRYLERVVECVKNNLKPEVDGYDGKRTVALIEALHRSLSEKREILL